MIDRLLANSSAKLPRAFEKRHRTADFEDSMSNLMSIALGMVSDDPAKHIPYVWGGKHLDKPTQWSSPPESNKTGCTARIGLDCSGFVQMVFEKAGFGRGAAELNAASLAKLESWKMLTDRGYFVYLMPKPAISDLLPGDVLFFADGGSIYHTGIFWQASETINGVTGPAMINSLGKSKCEVNIANEAAGKPTGVMVSVLDADWQNKLYAALRMVGSSYLLFNADGEQFAAVSESTAPVYAVYDTVANILRVVGYEADAGTGLPAGLAFEALGVNGPGTFPIPQLNWSDGNTSMLQLPSLDSPFIDSLQYFATSPPDWWHGVAPPETGGTIKIINWTRSPYVGSINGTFSITMNTYYTRTEDSTFMVDSVSVTEKVTKYYSKTAQISGSVGGLMGYTVF